uniref:Ig-like domain-containing protein n=2 Tax=Iconisemion striatum TaxID=60296 RepID=A0A1A7WVR7_9TELE
MALKTSLHLESADIGNSVTLQCLCHDDVAVMFYWYKQDLGKKPQLLSTFYKHNFNGSFHGEFNDSRFSLETGDLKNILLKISDLRKSDSGIYHCVKSNLHLFEFCEGTLVSVKAADSTVQALVHHSTPETIHSVTLNCSVQPGTCDGEHSVYWFKVSEDSHPGLIYSHGGRNDQCERKANTQTHTCVYNLPLKNLSVSDDKFHYCSVASCGHILFGSGTMQVSQGFSAHEEGSLPLINALSGALAFTTLLVVLLVLSVCKMSTNSRCRFT